MHRSLTTVAAACWMAALLVLPADASAQADQSVLDFFLPDGGTELQLQGSTSVDFDDAGSNGGSALINWGWLFTERQQIGATLVVNIRNETSRGGSPGGDLDLSGFGGPFYRYNLMTGKVAPYVGVSLGTTFGDFFAPAAAAGVDVPRGEGPGDFLAEFEVGSRWFLQRNLSFNLSGSMLYDIENSDLSDVMNVRFGFSYFWR